MVAENISELNTNNDGAESNSTHAVVTDSELKLERDHRPSMRQLPSFKVEPDFLCVGCHNAKGGVELGYFQIGNDQYHMECLMCPACNELIDPTAEEFSYITNEETETFTPCHEGCYDALLAIHCVVCNETIERNQETGVLEYLATPYWKKEKVCFRCYNTRDSIKIPQCTSCRRYEPKATPFNMVNDNERCICSPCSRTICMNRADFTPLWEKVLEFFKNNLRLRLFPELQDMPIVIVKSNKLFSQLKISDIQAPQDEGMIRGLCCAESEIVDDSYGLLPQDSCHSLTSHSSTNVWAILCLIGLPKDLTASTLAHEATHAWFKLHPDYDASVPIPPRVEEGVCQLIAYLYLRDGVEFDEQGERLSTSTSSKKKKGPTDEELRDYHMYCIKQDDDKIYGDGFRIAFAIYELIGIQKLLRFIVENSRFPSRKEVEQIDELLLYQKGENPEN